GSGRSHAPHPGSRGSTNRLGRDRRAHRQNHGAWPARQSIGRGISPKKSRSTEGADRKSTRLNSSHGSISYAVFCLKKKKNHKQFVDPRDCVIYRNKLQTKRVRSKVDDTIPVYLDRSPTPFTVRD